MVRVTMLAVGQGTSNLIEVYDNAGRMKQLILIDCGGDGFREHENVRSSAEYILKAMRARAVTERNCDRYLDLLIISHQDEDHHSILKNILKKLENKNQSIGIGEYWHFDEDDCSLSVSYSDFAKKVRKCADKDYTFIHGSDYGTLQVRPFYRCNEIELYLVYANAEGANLENSVSAVIEARIRDGAGTKQYRFLFPADATAETMDCIYNLSLPSGEDFYAMAAPHHGSFTSCNNVALREFLKKLPTEEIIISAGKNSQFGHPHFTFTDIAEDEITQITVTHRYRRNKNDSKTMDPDNQITKKCLYTSFWPEGAYGSGEDDYYHYSYEITQGIMSEMVQRAIAPAGDSFALSGAKKTCATTKYWHATAAPGMAERR